jgi:hypothetical protein
MGPAGIGLAGIGPTGIGVAGIGVAGIRPTGIGVAGIGPTGIRPTGIGLVPGGDVVACHEQRTWRALPRRYGAAGHSNEITALLTSMLLAGQVLIY